MAGSSSSYARSNLALNDGSCHHIAGLRRSGLLYLYVDGVLQTTSGSSSANVTNTASFIIGGDSSTYRYFDGVIDDVKVFNRALSAGEIGELYGDL
jgi:hypothetical protein